MARPFKNNADYFSHDSDMRNDIKVRALRRKYGHTGYAFWCMILEELTSNDNFEVLINDMTVELLAADFDLDIDTFKDILAYCEQLNLLQRKGSYYYSVKLNERLSLLVARRTRRRGQIKGFVQPKHNNNGVLDDQNPSEKRNGCVMDNQNTQSKVKEIKENKEGNSAEETSSVSVSEEIEIPVKRTRIDYQALAKMWNDTCVPAGFSAVTQIRENRKAAIRKIYADIEGEIEDCPAVSVVRVVFTKMAESDFIRENIGKWAEFNWVFGKDRTGEPNWRKVYTGRYDNRGARQQSQVRLGVGEFIAPDGRRTYGDGRATIPMSAPPRPSERYAWMAQSQSWVIL